MTLIVGQDTIFNKLSATIREYFKIFIITFLLFFVVLFLSAQEVSSRDEPGIIAVLIFSLIISFVVTLGFYIKDKVEEM